MEFYNFSKDSGKKISKFNSDFVMSRIIQTVKETNIGCMYIEENGIIGFHKAGVPQLLLIMNGEGYVRGEKEQYFQVQAGDAVFWNKDEWHETKTSIGLTAIVIESEGLDPSSFMAREK
ncbi:AraC family ligand binding domain-containing protein [Virgibacillus necropolis]|uniref:cupin n=1 Tax=Virgibacillus necropolis TaxID=163877 RepID=UPI00384CD079